MDPTSSSSEGGAIMLPPQLLCSGSAYERALAAFLEQYGDSYGYGVEQKEEDEPAEHGEGVRAEVSRMGVHVHAQGSASALGPLPQQQQQQSAVPGRGPLQPQPQQLRLQEEQQQAASKAPGKGGLRRRIDSLREREFSRLQGTPGHQAPGSAAESASAPSTAGAGIGATVYLDHAGAALYAESQLEGAFAELRATLLCNPHRWGADWVCVRKWG